MGVPQKLMVYNGKSYQNDKMDDFGVPPFLETYIYIYNPFRLLLNPPK